MKVRVELRATEFGYVEVEAHRRAIDMEQEGDVFWTNRCVNIQD